MKTTTDLPDLPSDEQLARALVRRLRGALLPGRLGGDLRVSDLAVEVELRVRRVADPAKVRAWAAEAANLLEAQERGVPACGRAGCEELVSRAVVLPGPVYRYACARCGREAEIEASTIAVVEMPRHRLAAIRGAHNSRSAAR